MAVVLTFLLTNIPYIVDELIRQKIFINQECEQEWCQVLKVSEKIPVPDDYQIFPIFQAVLGVSIVANSALNPFIFLIFNSKSSLAQRLTNGYCPLSRPIQNR